MAEGRQVGDIGSPWSPSLDSTMEHLPNESERMSSMSFQQSKSLKRSGRVA